MIGPTEKINTDILKNPDAPRVKTKEEKDSELRKTCAAFEGMFMEMMMKTMRNASMESSLIKKSNGEKIFTEMLDTAYVDELAKSPMTGIGDTLYNYLKATSPEYRDDDKGNNFPRKPLKGYDTEKIKNQGLAESSLDLLK